MKLTDSQLVILSGAARRDGGSVLPLPKSVRLNRGATTLVLKSLLKKKLVSEGAAASEDDAWREGRDGQRFALAITTAGLEAIGVEVAPTPIVDTVGQKADSKATKVNSATTPTASKKRAKAPAREGSKLSLLIDLLKRKGGATIEEVAKATGWQHHSVRGAVSGVLKKKLGLAVTSAPVDGRGRVYRIVAQA